MAGETRRLVGCEHCTESDAFVIVFGGRHFKLEIAQTEVRGEDFPSYGGDTGAYVFRVKAGDRWCVKPDAGFYFTVGVVGC